MFEFGLAIAVSVIIAKIAEADNFSGITWGGLTFLLCLGSFGIPLPALRVLLAGAVAFGLMFVYKAITGR